MKMKEILQSDVLVLGGGGAGIRAALTAAEKVDRVFLISDTPITESGSTFYPLSFEWGMLSASDEADAERFTEEILSAAKGCINPKLASYLAHGSKEAHDRFVEEGLPLSPMASMKIVGCFGQKSRGDFLDSIEAFISSQKQLVTENPRITCYQLTVISLLEKNGKCVGAMAVNSNGELIMLQAKAVVMALGGGEGLYEHRAAYGKLYGNAYAMAARHGIRIVNLEFIQFVPGTTEPIKYMNYFPFLLGEHPLVTNGKDEECMSQYLPDGITVNDCLDSHAKHGPFSSEDNSRYLEYAAVCEAQKGNGPGLKLRPGKLNMDDPRAIHWRRFLKRFDYDETTVMSLYPMAQGFNGGILLHDDLSTDMPGLFACGESSGGLHGPDRMGGLCILATQVFGKGAGLAASEYASNNELVSMTDDEALQQIEKEFDNKQGSSFSPEETLKLIRKYMQENACLRRNNKGLVYALEGVSKLSPQPLEHLEEKEAAEYFRISNAVDAAKLILTAMINRKESRGSHDRSDFEDHDASLEKMQWVSFSDGKLQCGIIS